MKQNKHLEQANPPWLLFAKGYHDVFENLKWLLHMKTDEIMLMEQHPTFKLSSVLVEKNI